MQHFGKATVNELSITKTSSYVLFMWWSCNKVWHSYGCRIPMLTSPHWLHFKRNLVKKVDYASVCKLFELKVVQWHRSNLMLIGIETHIVSSLSMNHPQTWINAAIFVYKLNFIHFFKFQVSVTIIEAKYLIGTNINPIVVVTVAGITNKTDVKLYTNTPYYNKFFTFDLYMTRAAAMDEVVRIKVSCPNFFHKLI